MKRGVGAKAGILVLAACWGWSGCGPSTPRTVPVTGVVTYRGVPVEGADVRFLAKESGPVASSRTDKDGRFALMTFSPGDGAVPGRYVVLISKTETVPDAQHPDNPYPVVRDVLPAKYGNPASSGLEAVVEPGKANDFTFGLSD